MKTRRNNKYVSVLSAVAIAFATSGRMATTADVATASAIDGTSACIWGDVNRDGEVNVNDSLHVLQKYCNELAMKTYDFAQSNWAVADVNADGKIDVTDAMLILRKYANQLACKDFYFPVEAPIKYGKEIWAKEPWYYWGDYSTNNPEESMGYISPGEIFKVEEYVGNNWYLSVIDTDKTDKAKYIYIPQEKWGTCFNYCEDETVVTTTVSQNTIETTSSTTTETVSTGSVIETTTGVTTPRETETVYTTLTVLTEQTTITTSTEASVPSRKHFEVGNKLKFVMVSIRYYETDENGYDQPTGWLQGGTEFTIIAAKYREDKGSDRYKVLLEDGRTVVLYVSNPEWFTVIDSKPNESTEDDVIITTTTNSDEENIIDRPRYKENDHLKRRWGSFDYYEKASNGHEVVAGTLPEGTEVIVKQVKYRDDKKSDRYVVDLLDGTEGIIIYISKESSFIRIE